MKTYQTDFYTTFEIWFIDNKGRHSPTCRSYKSKKLAENWMNRNPLAAYMQSYFIKEVPTIHQKLIQN